MPNKIYNFLIWLGLSFILIWSPFAFGAVPKRIWSIAPVLLVIAILTFLWLWKVNNPPTPRKKLKEAMLRRTSELQLRKTGLDKPIFVFMLLAVISFVFSIYKHDSFYALLRLLSYVAIYYLIINNYTEKFRNYIISLVICIGVGLSVYGLLQYFGVLPHPWWNPPDFLAATYVNHNHFAGYLELAIPVMVGVGMGLLRPLSRPRNDGEKIAPRNDGVGNGARNDKVLIGILVIALAIMLTAFVFAQSRGAWVSLGISLFVMNIILIKRKMLKKESLLIFVLLIVLAFAFLYSNGGLVSKRIESIKEVASGEASIKARFAIWQGTIDMIYHNPWIGVGIGDYKWGFPRYRPIELATIDVHYAHNDYLHMVAEMGVLALPVMLLMLVRVIGRGLGYEGRRTRDEGRRTTDDGRETKDEGRRTMDEGRGTTDDGLKTKDEGRRTMDEGRRTKDEGRRTDTVILGCAIGMLSMALHGLVDFNFHIPANMILFTIYAAIIMKETSLS